MILNLHTDTTVVHFPMYNFQPRYTFYKRATVEYAVNATGNLYMCVIPSLFSYVNSASTAVPYIVCNNVAYDNVDGPASLTTSVGLTDVATYQNLAAPANEFSQALVTAYNCEFTVTGVSLLNRRGMLTVVEDVSDDYLFADVSVTTATNLNTWFSSSVGNPNIRRSLLLKTPNKLEFDLASPMESHVYRWFPNFGGMSAHSYDFAPNQFVSPQITTNASSTYKRFHLFLSGCDTTTKIRLTHTFAYSATPAILNYDKYAVSWPSCFVKPDVLLSKLSSDVNHIFHHKGSK